MGLASHECRWFFSGSPGPEVETSFRAAGDWPGSESPEWPEDWREDTYLLIPGSTDMGIKWRIEKPGEGQQGGRLEFKGLTARMGLCDFGGGSVGFVERWMKWSYSRGTADFQRLLGDPASRRIRVEKKRILRKIRLDALGRDEEVPLKGTGSILDRGLQIELARVRVKGNEFWTLGFEAFPDDSGLPEAFHRNVTGFLADFRAGAPLTAPNSMSYPGWLPQFL